MTRLNITNPCDVCGKQVFVSLHPHQAGHINFPWEDVCDCTLNADIVDILESNGPSRIHERMRVNQYCSINDLTRDEFNNMEPTDVYE